MNIGQNIYQYRIGKKMTQEQLADQVGVTRQAVSRWETGNSLPDLDMVKRLAQLFGVSTDELLGADSHICQSCGSVLADDQDRGTEESGGRSPSFCHHCRSQGDFTTDETMENLAQRNTGQLVAFLRAIHHPVYPDIILKSYLEYLPTLQRWKDR